MFAQNHWQVRKGGEEACLQPNITKQRLFADNGKAIRAQFLHLFWQISLTHSHVTVTSSTIAA